MLAGAEFALYRDSNDNRVLDMPGDAKVGEDVTDQFGVASWDLLEPGVYFAIELEPPAGYSLDDDPIVGPIDLAVRGTVLIDGPDGFRNYKWRYALNLDSDARNLVDTDHVFTATLTVQKMENGPWLPAAQETLDLSLSGQGSIVPAGTPTCVTDDNGQCAITIHSDVSGDSTLSVSFDDKTTTATIDVSDTAVKHWIDYSIDITPDATNRVNTPHLFTVTVKQDEGSGFVPLEGVKPTLTKESGPGDFSEDNCATTGTNAAGQCTVKLTSAVPGTTVVKATYTAQEENTQNTFSDRATKRWVDYRLFVSNDSVNHAGDPHTFTVTLPQRAENLDWVAFPEQTVQLQWTGTGTASPATSCVTDGLGECEVTASSVTTGKGTLTATWGTIVDSGAIDLADSADKTWVDWDIAISPDGHTNLVGTEHTFTVTVRYDAGAGAGLRPLDGATPTVALGGAGSITDSTCDEGTDSDGECTVTITSTEAGDSIVTASYHAVHHEATEVFEDLSTSADKRWVDYRITVGQDAVNLVGDDHVFTVTLTRDSGNGFGALAGAGVDLAWSGGAGSSISGAVPAGDDATSCTTDASGQCKVTATSGTPLVGTLTASYSTTLDSGTHQFSAGSDKRWVNWALSVTPGQAENLVGTNHTFVVKVSRDDGKGAGMVPLAAATPTIALAGKGSIVASTCAGGTDAAGLCTVTITSAEPGASTVTAAFSATEDEASISLSASGRKLWVDYRISVTPDTAVNPVDTTHTFTVLLEKNTGNGWVVAGSETIDLALSGVGSIIGVDTGGIGSALAGVCTTDTAGTCRVTITSLVAGLDTLQAGFNAEVGETSRTYTDDGAKTWEVPVVVAGAVEELPRTGAGIAGQAWLGVSLVASGFALHLAGRRRRDQLPTG